MRTRKTLGGALAAILLLILTQLIAQGAAGLLAMIKLPAGVCNIVAGILYAGLAYAALRLLSEKVLHEHTAALGMPKLHIQPRWAITAVLLPLAVTGCYLLLFRGTFVRADMRGDEMFSTLSAGIVHAVWNIVIIGGGLSIGEAADAHAVVSYVLESDSFAVTGGQFGIEASVISLAGYCIVAAIAYAQLRADNEKRS